jgi:hypothetical protein
MMGWIFILARLTDWNQSESPSGGATPVITAVPQTTIQVLAGAWPGALSQDKR